MSLKLINCSGCLTHHARPSYLWRRKIIQRDSETEMAAAFSDQEFINIFGEDGEKGLVPDRDSEDYLPYIEKLLLVRQKQLDNSLKEKRVIEIESKLRRLSLSGNSQHSGDTSSKPAQFNTSYSAHSPSPHLPDGGYLLAKVPDLCKLRPEAYCSTPKPYEKLTFRELIRGCVKVTMYLRMCSVNIEGYLLHMAFIMDKAAIPGVYTTEGLVLYEREVTSKVIRGELSDWLEVDLASDSRFLSYEYTFDHVSRLEHKGSANVKSKRKGVRKTRSPIYDFDKWEPDVCWMWNCRQCEGCDRKHGVCGLCMGSHKAIDCDKSQLHPSKGESQAADL